MARHLIEPGQLELFGSAERLPRRPYCTDDLSAGLRIRSLAQAITKPYIQINPPRLRVWSIFDIDREGGGLAWEDALLPPPAWAAINRENGHAHLVWGLSAPVLVDGLGARDAPMRYLCAVESAFREKLRADPGYAGLITKNPAHPLWRVLRGPKLAYELGELAEWADLPRHVPKRKPEEIGLGRNVALFDRTRHWAYVAVRRWRDAKGLDAWNQWLDTVYAHALQRNADFAHPLDDREVWHIAKSVAKWVWTRGREAVRRSDERFSALQASRGRKGGAASGLSRAAESERKRAAARLMREAFGMSTRQIGAQLGVDQSTVVRWLAD